MTHLTAKTPIDIMDEFPKLKNAYDIKRYLAILTGSSVLSYAHDGDEASPYWGLGAEAKHLQHIHKSLPSYPHFAKFSDVKKVKTKFDMAYAFVERRGLKRKYLMEIEGDAINFYIQENKGDQLKDFKFYQGYTLEDLMGS